MIPIDATTRAAICARIDASASPEAQLFIELRELQASQQTEMQVAVFEAMAWRVPIRDANPYRTMVDAYTQLRRYELAVMMATMAIQMDDDEPSVAYLNTKLFELFMVGQDEQAALAVFLRYVERFPDRPPLAPAWLLAKMAERLGIDLPFKFRLPDREGSPADSVTLRVEDASKAAPARYPVYGANEPPFFLRDVAEPFSRPAIDVVRLDNASLLLNNGDIGVVDATGTPHLGLSPSEYPRLLKERMDRAVAAGEAEIVEADTAILISDVFIGVNLCHMLLDHITRLHLYERAGVDVTKALVVGAPLHATFQQEIVAHLGITSYLDVTRRAEIRAKHLFVATSCKLHHHPANRGSPAAIEYLRRRFLPSAPGTTTKVFISRRHARGRRVQNEAEVEALLQRWGFVSLALEDMPFREQVLALSGATHVVAPHGAGLTNAVFAQPGAHVLEMFHPLYGTFGYAALANAVPWSYAVMIGRDAVSDAPEFNDFGVAGGNHGHFGDRNFRVDLALLERWLHDTHGTGAA